MIQSISTPWLASQPGRRRERASTPWSARDDDGAASLRQIASDGRVLDSGVAALGTGSAVALGLLEALDMDEAANDPATAVRNVLETVMERDVDTGGEIDVWTLGSADQAEQGVRRFGEEEAER